MRRATLSSLDKTSCFASRPIVASVGDAGFDATADAASDASDAGQPWSGFCLGGCRSDDDCAGVGGVCQPETAWCVTKRKTFPKTLGEICTSPDDCACLSGGGGSAFCTQACRVGDACPAGWVCDPGLSEGAVAPPGLGAWCAKTCTKDADCPVPSARCVTSSVGRVCRFPFPAPFVAGLGF